MTTQYEERPFFAFHYPIWTNRGSETVEIRGIQDQASLPCDVCGLRFDEHKTFDLAGKVKRLVDELRKWQGVDYIEALIEKKRAEKETGA